MAPGVLLPPQHVVAPSVVVPQKQEPTLLLHHQTPYLYHDASPSYASTSLQAVTDLVSSGLNQHHYALTICHPPCSYACQKADSLLRTASNLYLAGQLDRALMYYNQVREAGSHGEYDFEACMGAGCALRELGQREQSAQEFAHAVTLRPDCPIARANFASSCYERGLHKQAIKEFDVAIALNPLFPDAYNNMGNALRALGRPHEAERCYRAALRISPTHAHALNNMANALRGRGALTEAASLYIASLQAHPGFAAAHCNFAGLLRDQGKPSLAESHYRASLSRDPNMAEAAAGLATALRDMGRAEEAVAYYKNATRLQPSAADHHANLANTYKDLGRVQESIASYSCALAIHPNLPDAFCNMVHSLAFICDWRRREEHLKVLINIIDKQLDVLLPGYNQQVEKEHSLEGRAYFMEARQNPQSSYYSNRPQTGRTFSYYYPHRYGSSHNSTPSAVISSPKGQMRPLRRHSTRNIDPSSLPTIATSVVTASNITNGRRSVGSGQSIGNRSAVASRAAFGVIANLPSVQPFHALIYPLSPEKFRALSILYAKRAATMVATLPLVKQRWTSPNPRLKIGYVSSDFANHPFAHLTQSIYGLHRSNPSVEVYCYALTPSDNSEWRKRIESTAEHFTDISKRSAAEGAQIIANDGIHVLINCNGYTKGARTEIFALRPAPVQVSFMGFPGPLGASYIEYFITDLVTSPPELANRIHTEALLYHPHTYFVNDHRRTSPPGPRAYPGGSLTRARYGLPENCFLFCNFNQLYKLDPDTFDVWARILRRTPHSKLWLLRFPAAAEERIREEAVLRGLTPDRIIFTDVAVKKEHVARCGLADLFLDTPTCNAHTTGTDALWSGLPMITSPGELFASRVAASLLTATNLQELICPNMAVYEDLAVSLATDPRRLMDIRQRLESARYTAPLFDTERWVRNLESLLWEAWRVRERGEAPSNIVGSDADVYHERRISPPTQWTQNESSQAVTFDNRYLVMQPVQGSVYSRDSTIPLVQRGVPVMAHTPIYTQETIR